MLLATVQDLLQQPLEGHENIKKRAYGQWLSTSGGLGREATTFYKRLADMLAQKKKKPIIIALLWAGQDADYSSFSYNVYSWEQVIKRVI